MKKVKGKISEEKVEGFLRNKGFEILERNFRNRFGEIDIIAKGDGCIWFVEVKTYNEYFNPVEKLNSDKIKRMIKVARCYMEQNALEMDTTFVLAVVKGGKVEILKMDVWEYA